MRLENPLSNKAQFAEIKQSTGPKKMVVQTPLEAARRM